MRNTKMEMKEEMVSRTYIITMSTDEMLAIMKLDMLSDYPLCERIENIDGRITNIVYEGHYGPHIWFTVDCMSTKDEAAPIVRDIFKLVEEYVEESFNREEKEEDEDTWEVSE